LYLFQEVASTMSVMFPVWWRCSSLSGCQWFLCEHNHRWHFVML